MIFRLTRFQSLCGGPDVKRALDFFDQLNGHQLVRLPRIPAAGGYPGCTCLDFEGGFFAMPLHDADNTPGPVRWQVLDANGLAIPGLHPRKLVGRPVTGSGFFRIQRHGKQGFMPYLLLGDDAHLVCTTDRGGGVISLERDERTELLHFTIP